MRVEPFTVGSFLHVVKRGARGSEIVRDEADCWRFLRMLFLLNDKNFNRNWGDQLGNKSIYSRPDTWEPREPVVGIVAYTLMPNHFHLILQETEEGGVSLFMKRLGQSMTNHANEKYEETGSLFQGAYRSKTIEDDAYLRYVSAYVMVKNTFELYPEGGLSAGIENFDRVWEWAKQYTFSSLGDYVGVRKDSQILNQQEFLQGIFSSQSYKEYARDVIFSGKWKEVESSLE